MRQLTIEERLARVEENVVAIRQMMETILHQKADKLTSDDVKEIMSVKQVAQFLGLDANIVYAKCAKGDIPYFKLGKQYRFKKVDILKWVKTQKGQPEFLVDEYVDRYMQEHILKS